MQGPCSYTAYTRSPERMKAQKRAVIRARYKLLPGRSSHCNNYNRSKWRIALCLVALISDGRITISTHCQQGIQECCLLIEPCSTFRVQRFFICVNLRLQILTCTGGTLLTQYRLDRPSRKHQVALAATYCNRHNCQWTLGLKQSPELQYSLSCNI